MIIHKVVHCVSTYKKVIMVAAFIYAGAAILCFLIDLILWSICHAQLFFFSRCLFYSYVCLRLSLVWTCVAGVAVLAQSFIFQGLMGTDLIIMVPLAVTVYAVQKVVEPTFFHEAILLCGCLAVHSLVVDYALMGQPLGTVILYRILLHFLPALFMLYLLRGSQGNRS